MNCPKCNLDMLAFGGCDEDRTIINQNGEEYTPIPYGDERKWAEMEEFDAPSGEEICHDCGTQAGNLHHPGCDMEECPVCRGQYLSCGCSTNENKYRLISKEWFDPDNPAESINGQ